MKNHKHAATEDANVLQAARDQKMDLDLMATTLLPDTVLWSITAQLAEWEDEEEEGYERKRPVRMHI